MAARSPKHKPPPLTTGTAFLSLCSLLLRSHTAALRGAESIPSGRAPRSGVSKPPQREAPVGVGGPAFQARPAD